VKEIRKFNIDIDRLIKLFWGLVLVTLPVTTFKYFPDLFQSSQNRHLALYPLAVLVPLLVFKQLKEKKLKFPPVLMPLFAFLAVAAVSSAWGFHLVPVNIRNSSYLSRLLKGWLAVGIGVSFFYVSFSIVRTKRELKQSLKWLFVGFSIAAIIGILQIIATQTSLLNYGKLHSTLEYFFTQTFHSRRIAGLAFEPSWFADQLVILYFPWLFSAVLFNGRISGKKYLDLIGILLLVGLLIFTYSRSGILNLGISVLITLLFTIRIWWRPLRKSIRSFFSTHSSRLMKYLKVAGLTVLIIAVVLVFYFAMSSYSYFTNIFNFEEEQTLFEYIVDISFGPRIGYAISGYEVFEENPILGVGLGASGLHMYGHFPDWLKTFVLELEHFFDPNYSVIPNPKNLYIKLLSETGLIGFWFFISFQIAVLGQYLKLIKNKDQHVQMVGFAGILFWFLISIRFLTMDSFASPVVWINMGIFIGMSNHIAFKKDKTSS